jgi:hypothetical protein
MRPADPARPAPDPWHSPWLSWFLPGSGICIAMFGLTVGAGWYAHWIGVVRGAPGLPSMKMNAALGFVLCGAALALMTTRAPGPTLGTTPEATPKSSGRKRISFALSALVAAVMLATVAEYRFGVSLGVDQLLIHDYLTPVNALPGRMSPLTATCFIFVAIGLMLSGLRRARAWQMAAAGLLACLVGVIAAVSLGGYLSGMEAAYGWERYTRMAVHTAAGMLLLGIALLGWTREVSRRQRINALAAAGRRGDPDGGGGAAGGGEPARAEEFLPRPQEQLRGAGRIASAAGRPYRHQPRHEQLRADRAARGTGAVPARRRCDSAAAGDAVGAGAG